MNEIRVKSSNDVQGVIDQLTTLNRDFRSKVEQLDEGHKNLISIWKGVASETFHNRYVQEEVGFTNFATAIDEYIQALQRIKENYETGEGQANAIAAGSK